MRFPVKQDYTETITMEIRSSSLICQTWLSYKSLDGFMSAWLTHTHSNWNSHIVNNISWRWWESEEEQLWGRWDSRGQNPDDFFPGQIKRRAAVQRRGSRKVKDVVLEFLDPGDEKEITSSLRPAACSWGLQAPGVIPGGGSGWITEWTKKITDWAQGISRGLSSTLSGFTCVHWVLCFCLWVINKL